jgi:FtsH-binding integral membrane protein
MVAVGAGFFTTSVLALCGDYALRAWAPQEFGPDRTAQGPKLLAITLIYTAVFGVIGGYVAARIGQVRPIMHSSIVGAIVLALSAAATVFMWSTAPPWYHVATLIVVLPVAIIGGKIGELQMRQLSDG